MTDNFPLPLCSRVIRLGRPFQQEILPSIGRDTLLRKGNGALNVSFECPFLALDSVLVSKCLIVRVLGGQGLDFPV